VVSWPWLGVRWWGDCSKCPPCRGGEGGCLGSFAGTERFHKKEVLFYVQARKMQVFLTDLMKLLQKGDERIKTKALFDFQNIMVHLKKTEASPVAVQLAEKLVPVFDEVRLMGQTELHRWTLGKDMCPSALPCEQHSEQGLLFCFLTWAPVGRLLGCAAQPSFSLAGASRARVLPSCTAGQDQTFSSDPKARG